MNIAEMALNNMKAQKAEAEAENSTPKAEPKLTVDPSVARKRVVSETLGEIKRRKTEDKNRVELVANGEVVGEATAVYKTKTQRSWTVTVNDVTVENQHTINKGLRALEEKLAEAPVIKAPQSETTVNNETGEKRATANG